MTCHICHLSYLLLSSYAITDLTLQNFLENRPGLLTRDYKMADTAELYLPQCLHNQE